MTGKSLRGKVVTGVGQGSFFAGLDWVKKQCLDKIGFDPWPGTLNLEVFEVDIPILEEFWQGKCVTLSPPNPDFCEGKCVKLQIGEIPIALVVPEEKVRIHGTQIIEILAPVKLKDKLNLSDGDTVTVSN